MGSTRERSRTLDEAKRIMNRPDADTGLMDLVDLAGGVAHDVNNSLNDILLRLALLERKGLPADALAEAPAIRRLGAQAGTQLKQWQQFTEIQQCPLQAVDLNRIVRDTISALSGQRSGEEPLAIAVGEGGASRAVPLCLDLAPDLPRVAGLPADLRRLLKHLLRSSAAAMAPGPGAVSLFTERVDQVVRLRVEDTGPPVAADLLPHLFRPFARLRPGSDGVGLAVSKIIATRHQASLQGWNRLEGGMAFQVALSISGE
jgi:signal transduction histidine kinase